MEKVNECQCSDGHYCCFAAEISIMTKSVVMMMVTGIMMLRVVLEKSKIMLVIREVVCRNVFNFHGSGIIIGGLNPIPSATSPHSPL